MNWFRKKGRRNADNAKSKVVADGVAPKQSPAEDHKHRPLPHRSSSRDRAPSVTGAVIDVNGGAYYSNGAPKLNGQTQQGRFMTLSENDLNKLTKDCDKKMVERVYLQEALQSIADEQPRVARSTPKGKVLPGAAPSSPNWDMKHCLFKREVYDGLLVDSMLKCDLLQHNLDDYIVEVRANDSNKDTAKPATTTVPLPSNDGHRQHN